MLLRERACKRGLTGLFLLGLSCSTALADGAGTPARGTYVGVFGGGGVDNLSTITQSGVVFIPEAAGGPLSVRATGRPNNAGLGFVGMQIGHEFSYGSGILPALEIEGLYLAGTRRTTLNNPTTRILEQAFTDTFPMRNAAFLANLVVSFQTPYRGVTPYIGGGLGAARVSVNGADSTQTNPLEAGINHFNSGPDSSAWTFAAQAKAGVRVALGDRAYLFTEYRYLFVGSTDQTFGPTNYPTHAATTDWRVRFSDTSNHLGVVGVGFRF